VTSGGWVRLQNGTGGPVTEFPHMGTPDFLIE
jgi:hypothetical protein